MDSNCGKSRVDLSSGKPGSRTFTARKMLSSFLFCLSCMLASLCRSDSPNDRRHDFGPLQDSILTACYKDEKELFLPVYIWENPPKYPLTGLESLGHLLWSVMVASEGLWRAQEEARSVTRGSLAGERCWADKNLASSSQRERISCSLMSELTDLWTTPLPLSTALDI